MNMTFIENFELLGFEIKVCKSMKEFISEIKDRCNWYCYGDTSFKAYMEDKFSNDCISNGWSDEDACLFIQYKNGKTYSFYPALGAEGEFKETGIEYAIISGGYGYTTYKNDLSAEWEFYELDENEEEAIETRTPVETIKLRKALLAEAEEQKTAPAEKQAEEQKQEQKQEQAEEQTEEQEQIPSEIPFVPGDFLLKPEYKIDVLNALKEAGYNSGYIRKNKIFPESTVQKFRTGNTDVSMNTIFRVCQILNKDISEIITFRKE